MRRGGTYREELVPARSSCTLLSLPLAPYVVRLTEGLHHPGGGVRGGVAHTPFWLIGVLLPAPNWAFN